MVFHYAKLGINKLRKTENSYKRREQRLKDVNIYHLTQCIPRQSRQNFNPDDSSSDSSALA